MLCHLNLCFPTVFFSKHAWLPSMASCMILSDENKSMYDLCTANQMSDFSSQMKNTRSSYRTANHLSVPTCVGIGPLSFCTLSLRPTFAGLKLITVIHSRILLRIPQTRFRRSGSQEWPPIILAYTTKTLI